MALVIGTKFIKRFYFPCLSKHCKLLKSSKFLQVPKFLTVSIARTMVAPKYKATPLQNSYLQIGFQKGCTTCTLGKSLFFLERTGAGITLLQLSQQVENKVDVCAIQNSSFLRDDPLGIST